jgi:hypothetical protein
MHVSMITTVRFFSARQRRKRSLLRKWWMKGIIWPRCTHCPMFCSSSVFDIQPRFSISDIDREYAINLFSGSAIFIVQKFNNQPSMTLTLVSPISAFNFAHASMSSRGRGSSGETSHETTVSLRRGALLKHVTLSVPSRSTHRPMMSSM